MRLSHPFSPVRRRAAALVAAAAAGLFVAIGENPPRQEPYRAMRTMLAALDRELPAGGVTRVEANDSGRTFGLGDQFTVGMLYWLRRQDREVVARPAIADRLKDPAYRRGRFDRVVRVLVDLPSDPNAREIARVSFADPLKPSEQLTASVNLLPPSAAR